MRILDHSIGLILLVPKERMELIVPNIGSISECELRDTKNQLSVQGLKVKFFESLELGFVYCRKTPTIVETEAMVRTFQTCDFLFGDLNLSPLNSDDMTKLVCFFFLF